MGPIGRTDEKRLLSRRLTLLKIQDRMLAFAHAGGAQVGRLSRAISLFWARMDEDSTSYLGKLVALKLGLIFSRLSELGFKCAIRFSELRYFALLEQCCLLELKHGLPSVSQQFEQLGTSLLQLRRVALRDKTFNDRLDAGER